VRLLMQHAPGLHYSRRGGEVQIGDAWRIFRRVGGAGPATSGLLLPVDWARAGFGRIVKTPQPRCGWARKMGRLFQEESAGFPLKAPKERAIWRKLFKNGNETGRCIATRRTEANTLEPSFSSLWWAAFSRIAPPSELPWS
jgi:hypothetical protein